MTAGTPLAPGTRLGRFLIDRRLGGGGMGEVYLAADPEAGESRALKLLSPELIRDPEARQRLAREATLARALDHPNVVRIFGFESEDGLEFLVMEYVDGPTLEEKLRSGPLDVREVLGLGIDVADALAAAHAIGLVHRDIKPSNLIYSRTGTVKVLDFGLARRIARLADGEPGEGTTLTHLTRTGTVLGTTPYMSPEQTRGEVLDGRSDIFSLGTVLYESATGRAPFRGASALEVMHEIARVDPVPVGAVRQELPRALDTVLSHALEKDPERRYASAADLRADLAEIREAWGPFAGAGRQGGRAAPAGRVPVAATSFVGRTPERAELRGLVARHPLVTITGVAGSGKTRLALEATRDLSDDFADGAWLVDLAAIQDPDLVAPAIASTLGVRERPGADPFESLLHHVEQRSLLLMLDNCEHVRAACGAAVGRILGVPSRTRILATSREALDVPGERVWPIPALAGPPEGAAATSSPADLLRFGAVRLFVDRARTANPDFRLTAENAPQVVDVCRQLDGLPLALELCAARVRVMPLGEIQARLEDRFHLLTAGGEALPPRQRTLRAAIDWSYDLLSAPEQALFRSLGAFVGGAALEAIEEICAGPGIPREGLLDLLSGLVEKCLVVPGEGSGGRSRYHLLESLRQYARDRLRESGEEPVVFERHGTYFEELAERSEPGLEGAAQSAWLERLDEEHGNLRAAMDRPPGPGHAERPLRIAGAIGRFWWVRGHWREGLRRFERVLAGAGDHADAAARARALAGAGRLFRERGDCESARRRYEESRALYQQLGDTLGVSMAIANLGITAQAEGDFTTAKARFEESLALQRGIGNLRAIAISYNNLGRLAGYQGDPESSWRYFGQGLELRRSLGDTRGVALSLLGMGNAALRMGDPTRARTHLLRGLSMQRELGDRQGSAYTLASLGMTALTAGDLPAARAYLAEALTTDREIGDNLGLAEALDGLAELAAREGHADRALRIHAAACALYETLGSPRAAGEERRAQEWRRVAEAALGPDGASGALAEGRAMTPERGIAIALGTASCPPAA